MNVLVVIDKLSLDGLTPSCIALNLRDTHKEFHDRGIRLFICGLRRNDPGADLLEKSGLPTSQLGLAPYSPRIYPALCRLARESDAALIHAHGYASANFGRLAGRRLHIPVVVHEHAVLRIRPHQWLADRACRNLTTSGLAVSRAVADFMARGRSIPRERIEVLPNGVELEQFRRMKTIEPEVCRRQLNWPEAGPLIGSAARFRHEKGLHVLLAAAESVITECPSAHFILAGEGPERARLMKQAARRGLRDHVLFPGFVADVPRLMRALTLLVIPSLSEGFSFAALEAWATGTPIVASRVGGLPEIITDEVNGLLCPPGNADSLAKTITRLIHNPDTRAALARQGRHEAACYSMERYVNRLATLYRHLTDHTPLDGPHLPAS